jgi:hypothetical protein
MGIDGMLLAAAGNAAPIMTKSAQPTARPGWSFTEDLRS